MRNTRQNKAERVCMPLSSLDGKSGSGAPGEREIRWKEFSERVYEKSSIEHDGGENI